MAQEEKICFVIAPIDSFGTEVRRRSDQMLKYVFETVAGEACGYQVLRADQLGQPGMITLQIINHLRDDALVIADLTGRNPNVL